MHWDKVFNTKLLQEKLELPELVELVRKCGYRMFVWEGRVYYLLDDPAKDPLSNPVGHESEVGRFFRVVEGTELQVQADSDTNADCVAVIITATPTTPRHASSHEWEGGFPCGEPKEFRISVRKSQLKKIKM